MIGFAMTASNPIDHRAEQAASFVLPMSLSFMSATQSMPARRAAEHSADTSAGPSLSSRWKLTFAAHADPRAPSIALAAATAGRGDPGGTSSAAIRGPARRAAASILSL